MSKNRERDGPQRISSTTLSEIDENDRNQCREAESRFVKKPMEKQTKSHDPVTFDARSISSKNLREIDEIEGANYVLTPTNFVQKPLPRGRNGGIRGLDCLDRISSQFLWEQYVFTKLDRLDFGNCRTTRERLRR